MIMKLMLKAAALAATLSFACATPAMAQSNPMVGGDLVEVSSITIDDGHGLDYAKHLAGMWRQQQEYAKSQGWITGYEVLANVNKRPGEPDVILVVRFKSIPDAAEDERRAKQFRDNVKQTDAQMQAASGERAKYRKVLGSQLWQVLNFRN
jgi:hypothetical protein